MPPRSVVSRLPTPLRNELDRRIRAAAYGDLVRLAEWLTDQGYRLSKSSLGVYSIDLRVRDQGNLTNLSERDRLFLELGRMRYRELQIADQLTAQEDLEP